MSTVTNEWKDFFHDASKRHTQVFLNLLQLNNQNSSSDIEILTNETSNIFSSLSWAYETNQVDIFCELIDSLYSPKTSRCFLDFQGKWIDLRSWLEKAVEVSRIAKGDEYLAKTLMRLGTILDHISDFRSAQINLEQSLGIYEKFENQKGKASVLLNLGVVLERQGNYKKAQSLFEQSLEIAESISQPKLVANAAHQLGQVLQIKRDFANANKWYEHSLSIHQSLDDKHGIGMNLHDLGIVAEAQNDLAKAREYYEASLKISEELSDRISVYSNISQLASIEEQTGNYQDAFSSYSNVLDIQREIGDREGESITLLRLSQLSWKLKEDTTSEQLIRESIRISEEIGNLDTLGRCTSILATKLRGRGNLQEARNLLQKCVYIFEATDSYRFLGLSYYHLGEIDMKEGDAVKARQNYLKALEIFKNSNDVNITSVLLALAEDDNDDKKEVETVYLDLLKKTQGQKNIDDHLNLAIGLAHLYEKMDRLDDALQILRPLKEAQMDAYLKQILGKVLTRLEGRVKKTIVLSDIVKKQR